MFTTNFTLLYLLFIPSILTTSLTAERCNPNDKKALLQFKQSLGNPYYFTSWTSDTDCCDWYSVQCDRTTHRIISLRVFQDDISGEIPASVGDLPYLQTLELHKLPNLYGPIPDVISKLKNLRYVYLSNTNLSGPVPSFFGQLQNLNYLDLSFNNLSGSIPPSLSDAPNMGGLRLDRNQLTGSIPVSFGSFKQGNFYIYLSHNKLSGPIPTTLGRVNFTLIDFSRNQLSGDASFLFGKDKQLQIVDLSRNMLEFDMSKMEFDSGLTNIELNHNKIYGNLPLSLADITQLQFFNVSYNRLCGPIPTGGQLNTFDQ